MRVLVVSVLATGVLFGLSASASGRSESQEWLTFNEVTLDGQKRVLSKHNIWPEESSYSRRRRQLAYVPYLYDGARSNRLWVADVDRPRDRLLFESPAWITDVAWSPDGEMIAFTGGGIWLIDADGRNPRRIADTAVDLSWSPDSELLAVTRVDEQHQVYIAVVSPTTGEARTLASGWRPRWSPDGRRLLFQTSYGTHVVRAEGAEPRTLARGTFPAWSPGGRQIVFVRYGDYASSIWVVAANGGKPRRVANGADFPLWSNDSRKIVFETNGHYCGSNLAVAPARGGRVRTLARASRIIEPLAWSRSGRKILFSGTRCTNQ